MEFTFKKNNAFGVTALAILGLAVVAPVLAWFIVTDTACPAGTRCYGYGIGDGGYGYGYGYGITTPSSPYTDPNYGYGYTSGSTSSSTSSSSTSTSAGWGWGGWLGSSSGAGTSNGSIINNPVVTPTVPGYEAILLRLATLVDNTVKSADSCKSCSTNYDSAMNSASMLRSSYEAFVKVFGEYKAGKATKDAVLASFKTFATYYYDVRTFGKTCKKSCDAVVSVDDSTDSEVLPATGAKTLKKRA